MNKTIEILKYKIICTKEELNFLTSKNEMNKKKYLDGIKEIENLNELINSLEESILLLSKE